MPLKVFNSKGELKGHYGTDQHWILLLTGFIVARSTLATTHFKGIESLYRWTSPLLPCLLSIFLVIFQKKVCSLRLVRDWIPAMSKKKKKIQPGSKKNIQQAFHFYSIALTVEKCADYWMTALHVSKRETICKTLQRLKGSYKKYSGAASE